MGDFSDCPLERDPHRWSWPWGLATPVAPGARVQIGSVATYVLWDTDFEAGDKDYRYGKTMFPGGNGRSPVRVDSFDRFACISNDWQRMSYLLICAYFPGEISPCAPAPEDEDGNVCPPDVDLHQLLQDGSFTTVE